MIDTLRSIETLESLEEFLHTLGVEDLVGLVEDIKACDEESDDCSVSDLAPLELVNTILEWVQSGVGRDDWTYNSWAEEVLSDYI